MTVDTVTVDTAGGQLGRACQRWQHSVLRDRRSLMTFCEVLRDCQLSIRDILATEEGGKLLTGHFWG